MNKGLAMVVGMSIAYLASLLGMILAWVAYRKRKKAGGTPPRES